MRGPLWGRAKRGDSSEEEKFCDTHHKLGRGCSKRSALLPATLGPHFGALHRITIMAYSKKRKYAKRAKTYKRMGRRSRTKKTPLRTLVRREIHRLAENKVVQNESAAYFVTNPIGAGQIYNMLPLISQGTGVSNRTGNRIRVMKFVVKIMFNIFNNVASLPCHFDMYILKYKNANQQTGIPTNAYTELLQSNNGFTAYTGFQTDYMRSINDDQWTLIKKRRTLLFNPNNTQNFAGATAQINPMRYVVYDLTKDVKKLWMYDDTTNTCTNEQLWICVGCTQSDGGVLIGNVGTYQWLSELQYEDM